MKVLNLACAQAHVFEGWFASEDDFQSQLTRGLLACPLCGDKTIHKRLSAPRLNLRAGTDQNSLQQTDQSLEVQTPAAAQADWQAALVTALRKVAASSEDVGERFATEARRMHYGEIDQRSIRGRASLAEAVELLEEGIDVLPLPDLPALKGSLQ